MPANVVTKVKGILVEKPGNIDVLKYQDLYLPDLQEGEVRVQIHAAGMNFIDIYQRRGTYQVPLPFTPGREAAGIVEAVGPGVTGVKPGDRVAYTYGLGAYAEASIIHSDHLIPLPDQLSFEQGAAFPLQGMTAQYLLHEFHKIEAGETILIHAAAGGMGLLLTQWAKHLGARVIGTVSTAEKAKIAKAAGADETIVYTQKDFAAEAQRMTGGKGVDMIIDGVGKTTFPGDLEAIKKRGDIVIYGSASGPADPIGPNLLQTKSISVHGGSLFNFISTRDEMIPRANAVLDGIREGWLRLSIGEVFALAEAAQAQKLLESRSTTGKIILRTR